MATRLAILCHDAGDAAARLLAFCARAGFKSRPGHSSGYFGWIGGRLYPQLPGQRNHALADEPFEINNNHGRLFGPAPWDGGFLFLSLVLEPSCSGHGKVRAWRERDHG